tara:strand:+ start:1622 stop:2245 length:624 start_codon:yes stop_codon:yes gene_type:complete
MAITTYDQLTKAIVDFAHREDLLDLIPIFIANTEQHMYDNETESLQLRSMEFISTSLTTGRLIQLPPNFESSRAVRLNLDGYGELQFRTPEALTRITGPARPMFFSIIGNNIEFDCVPDSEYTIEMQYFKKADALTPANQTNEILTSHSNIYLFGALYEVAVYEQDYQEQEVKSRRFFNSIKGANRTDKRGRYGNAPTMSIEGGMRP